MTNREIQIVECPRDAMQGLKQYVSTSQKAHYINSLIKVGFPIIDFGSFVSPKSVPQMRDTSKVVQMLNISDDTALLSIVLNKRGALEASNFEEIKINGIFKQTYQILYAGILSGGFAFVLQIYAQKNITPTPAAIIFSLEGVIATIAAWFLLSQILNLNNIIGCIFIILGVLISQIVPDLKINKVKQAYHNDDGASKKRIEGDIYNIIETDHRNKIN